LKLFAVFSTTVWEIEQESLAPICLVSIISETAGDSDLVTSLLAYLLTALWQHCRRRVLCVLPDHFTGR